MKKFIALFIIAVMIMLMFCACGMSEKAANDYRGDSYPGSGANSEYYSTTYVKDYEGVEVKPSYDAPGDDIAMQVEQKLIKRYNLSLETLEYDKAKTQIDNLTKTYGGYFSSSTESNSSIRNGGRSSRTGSYTIRIPSDKLDEYVEKISAECNVLSSTLNTEDITESYYSMQSRLDALALQEERILAMMEKADELQYLIQLEDKLTEIRSQINGINYQLQYYDKSVDYSYVYVSLQEVVEYQEIKEPTFFQKLGNALSGTFVTFGEFLGGLIIVLIWALPFLLFGGVIAIIIIACVRKDRKKKLSGHQSENEQNK